MSRIAALALLGAMLVPVTSFAQETVVTLPREGTTHASVLLGPGVTLNEGDRAADSVGARLDIRGEYMFFEDPNVVLGAVLPLTIASLPHGAFDQLGSRAMIEIAPSLRVHALETGRFLPYADAGVGVAHAFRDDDGGGLSGTANDRESLTGIVARTAIGTEIAVAALGGATVIIEPIGFNFYGMEGPGNTDGDVFVRYNAMFGVGGSF